MSEGALRIASFGLSRARGTTAGVRAWSNSAHDVCAAPDALDRFGRLVAAIAGRRGQLQLQPGDGVVDAALAPARLKVVSYNIRGGMGHDRLAMPVSQRVADLAQVVRRHRPDVLTLQEVDDFAVRSRWHDNLQQLADQLGATGAVEAAPTQHVTGRRQSVAVLTFNGATVERAQNVLLGETHGGGLARRVGGAIGSLLELTGRPRPRGRLLAPYLPRNAVDVLVRTPDGGAARVATTHVSGSMAAPAVSAVHARQLAPLAQTFDTWRGAGVLTGDFNVGLKQMRAWARERTLLARAGLTDVFDEMGLALDDPARATNVTSRAAIDRAYATRHFDVVDAAVDRSAGGSSDHWPIVFELRRRTPKGIPS